MIESPVFTSSGRNGRRIGLTTIMNLQNFYDEIPTALSEELFTDILQTETLRVERIVSHGHTSPESFWYDQDQNEWVMVLEGAARIRFENKTDVIELGPGDYITIPAHKRHRIEWTAEDQRTVWLAIHFRDDRPSSIGAMGNVGASSR